MWALYLSRLSQEVPLGSNGIQGITSVLKPFMAASKNKVKPNIISAKVHRRVSDVTKQKFLLHIQQN